jgi:hypothetical protein
MEDFVNLSDVPVIERQHARAGLFRSQSLLRGVEGTPENFFLQLSRTYADFHSPRHRHNFDQVRVQLQGDADFARDGVMHPGTIAYFPEGVFYGPQSIAGESLTLVLQFGGASGSGYISEERYQQAVDELKRHGSFENGIYRRAAADGGRKNQDAYEAVWEHVHGRRIEYASSDYAQPVFLDPRDFEWQDMGPGLRRKALGQFHPRGLRIDIVEASAGAEVQLEPHSIIFVLEGEGDFDGKPWRQHTTMRTGQAAETVRAGRRSELLRICIPPLTGADHRP